MNDKTSNVTPHLLMQNQILLNALTGLKKELDSIVGLHSANAVITKTMSLLRQLQVLMQKHFLTKDRHIERGSNLFTMTADIHNSLFLLLAKQKPETIPKVNQEEIRAVTFTFAFHLKFEVIGLEEKYTNKDIDDCCRERISNTYSQISNLFNNKLIGFEDYTNLLLKFSSELVKFSKQTFGDNKKLHYSVRKSLRKFIKTVKECREKELTEEQWVEVESLVKEQDVALGYGHLMSQVKGINDRSLASNISLMLPRKTSGKAPDHDKQESKPPNSLNDSPEKSSYELIGEVAKEDNSLDLNLGSMEIEQSPEGSEPAPVEERRDDYTQTALLGLEATAVEDENIYSYLIASVDNPSFLSSGDDEETRTLYEKYKSMNQEFQNKRAAVEKRKLMVEELCKVVKKEVREKKRKILKKKISQLKRNVNELEKEEGKLIEKKHQLTRYRFQSKKQKTGHASESMYSDDSSQSEKPNANH